MVIRGRVFFHFNDYGPIELNEIITAEHKGRLKSLFSIIAIIQILEKESKTPSQKQGIIIGWST